MMPIARMIYFHTLLTFVIVKIETSQCLANFQNQPKLDLQQQQQNSFGFLYVSRLPASFPLSMLHSLSLSKLSLAPSLIIYLKKKIIENLLGSAECFFKPSLISMRNTSCVHKSISNFLRIQMFYDCKIL